MIVRDSLYLGGNHEKPSSAATIEVRSPFDGALVGRVPAAREADVDRAVALARAAFDDGPWPRTTGTERADVLDRLLAALQKRAGAIAETITREMGSPISFSHAGQVFATNLVLDYFAKLARSYAFEERRDVMIGELGPEGLRAYLEPQTICLAPGSEGALG